MHWSHGVLIVVCAFALWQRYEPITRTALVMLGSSAIMTAWFWLVEVKLIDGFHLNPIVQLAVDILSAFLIMRDPADREQGWLGMILGIRIGASIAFLQYGIVAAETDYWRLLNMAGLALLLGLFLWSEGRGGQLSGLCRRAGRALRNHISRPASGEAF